MVLDAAERARRVEVLFSAIYPRGGRPATTALVVATINRRAGSMVLSDSTLTQIRGAESGGSTLKQDRAIANFFGVPVGYLTGRLPPAQIEAQVGMLAAVRSWDEQRLDSLLGALGGMITSGMVKGADGAAYPPLRRPTCLRLVRSWRPVEDKMNTGRMNEQRLWRRCQPLVRELERSIGLPEPGAVEEFIERLAIHRGRPIELRPFTHDEVPAGICGLWIDQTSRDVIGFPTEARHAPHIVMHEVGHMLCGHRGRSAVGGTQLRSFMPDLDPDMVHRVLGRSVFSDREEREAELVASLIMDRVAATARRSPVPAIVVDPLTQRLRRAFGG